MQLSTLGGLLTPEGQWSRERILWAFCHHDGCSAQFRVSPWQASCARYRCPRHGMSIIVRRMPKPGSVDAEQTQTLR